MKDGGSSFCVAIFVGEMIQTAGDEGTTVKR